MLLFLHYSKLNNLIEQEHFWGFGLLFGLNKTLLLQVPCIVIAAIFSSLCFFFKADSDHIYAENVFYSSFELLTLSVVKIRS